MTQEETAVALRIEVQQWRDNLAITRGCPVMGDALHGPALDFVIEQLDGILGRAAEPMGQAATAAWMGVDVATMNLAHDCLHHALCDALKVPSRAMRQAAGETLDPAEQHLADLEENAVLHAQRWLHAAGVL